MMYNLYVLGGALLTDILVVLGGLYYYVLSPAAETHLNSFPNEMASYGDSVYAGLGVTRYMLISIFLAFTVVGGDNMVYLYFLIPVKMKWLGYVDLLLLTYYFVTGGLFTRIIVFSSVANYFIYAYINRSKTRPTLKDRKRQKEFVKAKQKGYKPQRTRGKRGDVIDFPGGSIIPPGTGNPQVSLFINVQYVEEQKLIVLILNSDSVLSVMEIMNIVPSIYILTNMLINDQLGAYNEKNS